MESEGSETCDQPDSPKDEERTETGKEMETLPLVCPTVEPDPFQLVVEVARRLDAQESAKIKLQRRILRKFFEDHIYSSTSEPVNVGSGLVPQPDDASSTQSKVGPGTRKTKRGRKLESTTSGGDTETTSRTTTTRRGSRSESSDSQQSGAPAKRSKTYTTRRGSHPSRASARRRTTTTRRGSRSESSESQQSGVPAKRRTYTTRRGSHHAPAKGWRDTTTRGSSSSDSPSKTPAKRRISRSASFTQCSRTTEAKVARRLFRSQSNTTSSGNSRSSRIKNVSPESSKSTSTSSSSKRRRMIKTTAGDIKESEDRRDEEGWSFSEPWDFSGAWDFSESSQIPCTSGVTKKTSPKPSTSGTVHTKSSEIWPQELPEDPEDELSPTPTSPKSPTIKHKDKAKNVRKPFFSEAELAIERPIQWSASNPFFRSRGTTKSLKPTTTGLYDSPALQATSQGWTIAEVESNQVDWIICCPITKCGEIFYKKGDFRKHLETHGRFEICTNCWETFSNQGQLGTHLNIVHGTTPFRCTFEFCQRSFGDYLELDHHISMCHVLTDRPYKCQKCSASFKNREELYAHLKSHLGEVLDF